MEIAEKKEAIRRAVKVRLARLSRGEAARRSRRIVERLRAFPPFRTAETVALYVSKIREVCTHALIRESLGEGKRVLLPRCLSDRGKLEFRRIRDFDENLAEGAYGILEPGPSSEPVLPSEADLFVVPGLAFDREGRRLGRGGGYYDALFSEVDRPGTRVGLAYPFQVLEKLPEDEGDMGVDWIVMEEETLDCRRKP